MKTTLLTLLLAGPLARPALAHPGHGLPGWLHHGEPLVVASAVVIVALAWRVRAARARRRGDDR